MQNVRLLCGDISDDRYPKTLEALSLEASHEQIAKCSHLVREGSIVKERLGAIEIFFSNGLWDRFLKRRFEPITNSWKKELPYYLSELGVAAPPWGNEALSRLIESMKENLDAIFKRVFYLSRNEEFRVSKKGFLEREGVFLNRTKTISPLSYWILTRSKAKGFDIVLIGDKASYIDSGAFKKVKKALTLYLPCHRSKLFDIDENSENGAYIKEIQIDLAVLHRVEGEEKGRFILGQEDWLQNNYPMERTRKKLLGVHLSNQDKLVGEQEKKYEFVEPRMEGTLYDLILNRNHSLSNNKEMLGRGSPTPYVLPIDFSWKDLFQILLGEIDKLDELHKNGIVHRDVKPQNFLFDANPSWIEEHESPWERNEDGTFTIEGKNEVSKEEPNDIGSLEKVCPASPIRVLLNDLDFADFMGASSRKFLLFNWDRLSTQGLVLPSCDYFGLLSVLSLAIYGKINLLVTENEEIKIATDEEIQYVKEQKKECGNNFCSDELVEANLYFMMRRDFTKQRRSKEGSISHLEWIAQISALFTFSDYYENYKSFGLFQSFQQEMDKVYRSCDYFMAPNIGHGINPFECMISFLENAICGNSDGKLDEVDEYIAKKWLKELQVIIHIHNFIKKAFHADKDLYTYVKNSPRLKKVLANLNKDPIGPESSNKQFFKQQEEKEMLQVLHNLDAYKTLSHSSFKKFFHEVLDLLDEKKENSHFGPPKKHRSL